MAGQDQLFNLFGGFMQGRANKATAAKGAEKQKLALAIMGLQKQELALKLKKQAASDAWWAERRAQTATAQGQPSTTPPATNATPIGDSFDQSPPAPGKKVAGALAADGLPTTIMEALSLKNTTGVDLTRHVTQSEIKRHNEKTENIQLSNSRIGAERYNRGNTEWKQVEVINPDGSKSMLFLPKYGIPGDEQQAGQALGPTPNIEQLNANSFQTKLPPVESYEYVGDDGRTYSVIRNKQTGQNVTQPVVKLQAKAISGEVAGKMAMAAGTKKIVPQLKSMLFDKGGGVDRKLLFQSWAPFGGLGKGRLFNSRFKDALDARIRLSTGAAMKKEEEPFYNDVYKPHPLDNDATIKDKLHRMDVFVNDFFAATDPSGAVEKRMTTDEQPGEDEVIKIVNEIDALLEQLE